MTASTAEHFDAIKMLLRSKSLIFQAFLRRVIVLRDGPCPLALSRCSVFGTWSMFFDNLRKRKTIGFSLPLCLQFFAFAILQFFAGEKAESP